MCSIEIESNRMVTIVFTDAYRVGVVEYGGIVCRVLSVCDSGSIEAAATTQKQKKNEYQNTS